MTQPSIAIVGSARKEIVGDKEQEVRKACRDVGEALAQAGWRLVVYSSDDQFIEPEVVAGYVASGVVQDESIICCYPQKARLQFPEMETNGILFRGEPDASGDWETSFWA